MTVSLLIATYNWPQALERCLESVMTQRIMPNEIIIADDGSGPETRRVVERFEHLSSVPLLHIWHPDDGFRLASIRNKAIAASSCDYIIQIDGDVILERHFVKDHMAFARRGYYVSGSRGIITEELLPKLMSGEVKKLTPFTKGINNRNNAMRIPWLRKIYPHLHIKRRPRGCNMAFWREETIQINGYDENFKGWGGEDEEFLIRMMNIGQQLRPLRFGGVQYHIFHKKATNSNYDRNCEIYQISKKQKITRCEKGVDQYLSTAPHFYPAAPAQE